MSNMKLTLLMVAVSIAQACLACNYNRLSRVPNYASITSPKKVLDIPQAHGICIAPNGNYAVVTWNSAGKVYMYRSSGEQLALAIEILVTVFLLINTFMYN